MAEPVEETEEDDSNSSTSDSDSDADMDSDADSDADMDTDTDTDVDVDTDFDTDMSCTVTPTGAAWGNACDASGSGEECGTGMICAALDTDGDAFCSPGCCALGQPDYSYCTDQGTGEEYCAITMGDTDTGPFYCIIICTGQSDCPDGTACIEVPEAGVSICMGFGDIGTD